MDYFEEQQRLSLSPVMYREKNTVYLYVRCNRKKYKLNNEGICEQWENDFRKLLELMYLK